jgi:hypothetical protein
MARINTTQMVQLGTSYGSRIQQVQQDPAVRKACATAATDVVTAVTSTRAAFSETLAAWRRTGNGSATVSPLAA